MAQSNVQIYGIVDLGYMVMDAKSPTANIKSTNRIESGGMAGSRIGFKGTEDLGNGMKAMFTLEYNIAPDSNSGIGDFNSTAGGGGNNATSTQARQQNVGLSTPYGTVMAGRLQSAGYYFGAAYSPFAGTAFDNAGLLTSTDYLNAGSAARLNNAIAYISPTFAGFTFEWDHSRVSEDQGSQVAGATCQAAAPTALTPDALATTTCAQKDSTANEYSLKYANGPLTAQGIYFKLNSDRTTEAAVGTAGHDDVTMWGLGASYNFGVAKVMGMYKNKKIETGAAPSGNSDKMWILGVSAPVGAKGTVLASYAQSDIGTRTNGDAKGFGVGYRYALSKRTTLYANYTQVDQDSNGTSALVNGYSAGTGAIGTSIPNISTQYLGALTTPAATMVGIDSKAYGVGINHTF